MVEIPEEEVVEMAECPTCSSEIPLDAAVCPSCGQEFEEEVEADFLEEGVEADFSEDEYLGEEQPYVVDEYSEEDLDEAYTVTEAVPGVEPLDPMDDVLADEEKPYKMFWIGVVLVLLGFFGGPVFSYLHDALEIPVGPFTAYENFGWVNWTVAIIGSIMTAVGVVLLIIGWAKIKKWRIRIEELMEESEEEVEIIE